MRLGMGEYSPNGGKVEAGDEGVLPTRRYGMRLGMGSTTHREVRDEAEDGGVLTTGRFSKG